MPAQIWISLAQARQCEEQGRFLQCLPLGYTYSIRCVKHHDLRLKLMKRHVPLILIEILEFWLSNCCNCIKWASVFSDMFSIESGVRQGSVLSPFLFAVYINDLITAPNIGRETYIILYADGIFLLASSVYTLQSMFTICEKELLWLDMSINVNKSACLRIGPRCENHCVS